ncbi:uncharacterized protein [Primulina eburnea]|uniref:uncharacterized protein n=1 Tax=Primulina eburnea TaxID=1245227 RepID=UPI003C6C03E4
MERQFHIQFYITEPEVCIADLSRVTQKKGESVEYFIDMFKKIKNRCKVFQPETDFVKMAQKALDFELRKKFQGMEFRDFFEVAAKVAEYEELLREESYKKKTCMGSYYQEVEDVALTKIRSAGSCTVPLLKKKPTEHEKKNSSQLPKDMIPPTEELKGREYCKYHNSYNHATKSCWAFKNILQDRINKGVMKFPNKQESMAVDDDHFPPVALVNVNVTDLRDLLNEKRR